MKRGTPDHPKVYALAERLKVRRPTVLGTLELLWHFTAKYAPRGDIGRYSENRIEAALDWRGKRGALIAALVEAGWLDRIPPEQQGSDGAVTGQLLLSVHDWADHADDAVRKRLARLNQHFVGKVTGQPPVSDGTLARQRPENGSLPVPVPVPVPEPCQAGALPEPGPDSPGREQGAGVSKVPVLVAEDGFEEFRQACEAAGMSGSGPDWDGARLEWCCLDFEQRAAATQGIRDRVSAGEYSDPAYVPSPLNYLRRRKWTAPVRDKRARARAGLSVAEEMRGL